MQTKAETGVMQPQAKEHPGPLEEAMEDASLGPSEGTQPCEHLDFGLLASSEGRHFCCLRPPDLW